jgi:exopolysaccharide production protein ExoQ
MKVELGAHRAAPPAAFASFPTINALSLGIVLLFAAAAYVVFGWALAFGGFGSSGSGEAEQLSQSNVANQLIWISLSAAGAYVIVTRITSGTLPIMSASLFFLSAYLVLAFLSMFWALAPDISLRRAFQQFLIMFIFVGVTIFVRDKVRILNAVYLVFAIAILLNTLLFPVIPSGPLGYAGIHAQKNTLGAIAALCLIFSISYLLSPRASYKIFTAGIGLLSAGLLVVSQSKTSLGLAIICPLLAAGILVLSRMFRTSFMVAMGLIAAIGVLAFLVIVEVLQLSTEDISLLLFNDTTFTGRTYIWNYVLNFFDQKSWLGWGYQSFWAIGTDAPNLKADNFISGLNQSHNGYMDILLETGIVGFIVVVGFLLSLCNAIDRAWGERADVAILLLSLTLFCSAHNLLESSLTRGFAVPWVILLLITGLSNPARERVSPERNPNL